MTSGSDVPSCSGSGIRVGAVAEHAQGLQRPADVLVDPGAVAGEGRSFFSVASDGALSTAAASSVASSSACSRSWRHIEVTSSTTQRRS